MMASPPELPPSPGASSRTPRAAAGDARPPPIPGHPAYQPISEEVVRDGRIPLQRVRFRSRRRDGTPSRPLTREPWRRGPGAAMVLPWDPARDRVALMEQFRLPALAAGLDPMRRECPAGPLDDGEPPGDAARRELAEETGPRADRPEPFGRFLLSPGGSDETPHFLLARADLPALGDGATAGLDTGAEERRVLVVTRRETLGVAADGRVQGAPVAPAPPRPEVHHGRPRAGWSPPDKPRGSDE